MLVVSRAQHSYRDDVFANFHRYIKPGDGLVLNNTRVFPARLRGQRKGASGAQIEVFLVRALTDDETQWISLVRPAKRVRAGEKIYFGEELQAEVLAEGDFGERTIRLISDESIAAVLERLGETPLPPYIHRPAVAADRERYQTVFAKHRGSIAAPTAGLHFTPEVLAQCRAAGADIAYVTLHVGLGTFAPVRELNVAEIRLHEEYFEIAEPDAGIMRAARRLLCVGTTSVRTVETALLRGGLREMSGQTNLFIYPGFHFRAAGAMLTNFHLPQSSLLMLVSAFAGRDLMLRAYRHAVAERYRFFSYGDCMLIE
jgi:S-adenosylmethionine:tRNA ribosyltransferase-isomerase